MNKVYLVYLVDDCRQGSEGYSSIIFPCVVYANNDKTLVEEYISTVNKIFDVDISEDKTINTDGHICFNYIPLYKTEILVSTNGHMKGIDISTNYTNHYGDSVDHLNIAEKVYEIKETKQNDDTWF